MTASTRPQLLTHILLWSMLVLVTFACRPAAAQTGACCSNTNGSCAMTSFTLCNNQFGSYAGSGSTCGNTRCGLVACCRDDSVGGLQCRVVSELGCTGVTLFSATCTPYPCNPYGRCCRPDQTCYLTSPENCQAASGFFSAGVSCSAAACSSFFGACCAGGSCAMVYQQTCAGQFHGAGSTCGAPCPPFGACCSNLNFSCSMSEQPDCVSPFTTFAGGGSSCVPNPCAVFGACCTGTACAQTIAPGCAGSFQGVGVACGPTGNPTTCCPANFNGQGGLSVQDIFDFLAAYFSQDPRADLNHAGGISVQDIFDFLAAYFGGCA